MLIYNFFRRKMTFKKFLVFIETALSLILLCSTYITLQYINYYLSFQAFKTYYAILYF